jgi:chlorite dismutase
MLHQMLRVKWGSPVAREGLEALAEMQNSAAFTMLGHKGDVLLLHMRRSLDELNAAESALGQAGCINGWSRSTPTSPLSSSACTNPRSSSTPK